MKLNWKLIDEFLIGEANSDDLPVQAKEEIAKFLEIHEFDVFSDETLEQLAGIWDLAYKKSYEIATGTKIPNIFHHLAVEEEENEPESL